MGKTGTHCSAAHTHTWEQHIPRTFQSVDQEPFPDGKGGGCFRFPENGPSESKAYRQLAGFCAGASWLAGTGLVRFVTQEMIEHESQRTGAEEERDMLLTPSPLPGSSGTSMQGR